MRKTLTVTITAEGRDKGKQYLLTEMSATAAERWAAKAFLGLARSGLEVPEDLASLGLAGIAMIGFRAIGGMQFAEAQALLDEMFGCVQMIPDPSRPEVTRKLVEDDIEEVATRLRLRKEIFGLHVDFSSAGARLTSASAASAKNAS